VNTGVDLVTMAVLRGRSRHERLSVLVATVDIEGHADSYIVLVLRLTFLALHYAELLLVLRLLVLRRGVDGGHLWLLDNLVWGLPRLRCLMLVV